MTEQVSLCNQLFELHCHKAAYWHNQKTLLIADLHLGKATHFRKAGMAVPSGVIQKNWARLHGLFQHYQPARVLFLGDLFHSQYNNEWEAFIDVMQQYPQASFELITGNHDILGIDDYQRSSLVVHLDSLHDGPFLFSHHPLPKEALTSRLYNLCGHIHPGVRLRGTARQSLRLACFLFGQKQGILPAFGGFTGMYVMQPKSTDRVYVVAHDQVVSV